MLRAPASLNVWLLPVIAMAMLQSGCVRRRMTINSNPPGALVYVDNYEIGTTPCSTDFIYYGTRNIRLVKDGYETLAVQQPISAPWYQIPPLDFFSENLVPGEISDQRQLNFTMVPQNVVPTGRLLERAEELRQGMRAQASGVVLTEGLPPTGGVIPQTLPPQGSVVPAIPLPEPAGIPQTLPPGGIEPQYVP